MDKIDKNALINKLHGIKNEVIQGKINIAGESINTLIEEIKADRYN